jgi:hypothetical protein
VPRLWPDAAAYREALQNPRTCFVDAELRDASPTTDARGFPKAWSGNFAVVFQVRTGSRVRAVRCFQGDVGDREFRYQAIDKHLSSAQAGSITHFEYVAQGIRVRGNSYPILIMDWIEGLTLDSYLRSVSGSPEVFRALADRWLSIIRDLEAAGIAHGDLQHGNILVSGGDLRLVDYDGMFVPPLRGRKGVEVGHRAYQHPLRNESDFGPETDRFSALVIYSTLLSLSLRPALAARCTGEYLLFRADDYKNPRQSTVFSELAALGPEVATVVGALRAACMSPVSSVPRLLDLVTAPATSKLPGWMRDGTDIPAPTHVHVDPPRTGPRVSRSTGQPAVASSSVPATPSATAPWMQLPQSAVLGATSPATVRRFEAGPFFLKVFGWFWVTSVIATVLSLATNGYVAVFLIGAFVIFLRSYREQPVTTPLPVQSWNPSPPVRPSSPLAWHPPSQSQQRSTSRRRRRKGSQTSNNTASFGTGTVVASSVRSKYHRPGCEWVGKMSPRNRISFASAAAAQQAGYQACRVCSP